MYKTLHIFPIESYNLWEKLHNHKKICIHFFGKVITLFCHDSAEQSEEEEEEEEEEEIYRLNKK